MCNIQQESKRAKEPIHSNVSFVSTSFTLPILSHHFFVYTHDGNIVDMHKKKKVWVQACFLITPTPTGFVSIINNLSKCHSPLKKILIFSFCKANLETKFLSPKLSTFISLVDLYACGIAALRPSLDSVLQIFLFSFSSFPLR